MATLSEEQIEKKLKELKGWRHREDTIVKSFDCDDFVGSVKFVDSIVEPAEEMNHHPDVAIAWSQVEITLTTHSEGGVTENDFELAKKIDELA